MKSTIFTFVVCTAFLSCLPMGPQPSDMVGQFVVSADLNEEAIDKKAIKKDIDDAMKKAGEEIEKSREEMMKDIDLENIDTTTLEGKLEYLGKSFGSKMGNIGLDIGKLSKDFGGLISDITSGSIDFSTSFLRNLKLDIELQEDGDVKVKNKMVSMGFNNATWKVDGDTFILTNSDDNTTDEFKIINRESKGFTLEKDKLQLHFTKKTE